MTGAQLKALRAQRGWTLREMAKALGDAAFTTIRKWESDENAAKQLPSWVDDRLLRDMPITLPLEELHALLDQAREEKKTPEQIFVEALREHARRRLHPEEFVDTDEAEAPPDNITSLYDHHASTEPDHEARVAEPATAIQPEKTAGESEENRSAEP
jgi:transcriptional regulator with XRE-family HTH domain